MTLAELAVTIAVLGVLGLVGEPLRPLGDPGVPPRRDHPRPQRARAHPARATVRGDRLRRRDRPDLLLFFLGLEFSVDRLLRSGRHVGLGGAADLLVNAGLGLLVGVAAFGPSFAALVLAACVYVSSSAIAVKALIDFRRLADDETDLVLAILLFEDIAIAAMLGFVATGGGSVRPPRA